MKRLLVTGFEPFGGESINPSWEAVQKLSETIADYSIYKCRIPVVFGEAAQRVLEAAGGIKPDVILCVGQAGGRDGVTPERIAVNIRDARLPDNAGNQPKGEFVLPEGDAAYFSTLPAAEMEEAIRAAGVNARVSNSAGAFVCNDTLYTLLHRCRGTGTRVGFIHVPWLPEQGKPSLPLEEMVKALEAAIRAIE